MEQDMQVALELWNTKDNHFQKKHKHRKENFLLKFPLFTTIYQKKGP